MIRNSSKYLLDQEAHALLSRLDSVKPFSMHMPMVMAAAISPAAMSAIENMIQVQGKRLRTMIKSFIIWLKSSEGQRSSPQIAQKKFTLLRLRFGIILSQFDIFAEAVTQRSEHEYGVSLSALDVLAEDALKIDGFSFDEPPMICYLDRGLGAAIRRAQTKLPGGTKNPVSIIRVPRERMIGSAVASSIVHEVGHQAAAILDLVPAVKKTFSKMVAQDKQHADIWSVYQRWTSEMLADFWSVGKVGITGCLGIMSVVSLPRPLVFHFSERDVHPTPWLRVKLSCAMGNLLYPHPQWMKLAGMWEELFPLDGLDSKVRLKIERLQRFIPQVVSLIGSHKCNKLNGKQLKEIMPVESRQPDQLLSRFSKWKGQTQLMNEDPPTLTFAVIGQAKFNRLLNPMDESPLLDSIFKYWALKRAINTGRKCTMGDLQTKKMNNREYMLSRKEINYAN